MHSRPLKSSLKSGSSVRKKLTFASLQQYEVCKGYRCTVSHDELLMLQHAGYSVPSPERVIISAPPLAELRWTTATPHITFGTVSRQDSCPGSPGADFQIAKLNGTSPVQQGAAADPAEIHGILNYENQFSVGCLDSGPISTLINEPAEHSSVLSHRRRILELPPRRRLPLRHRLPQWKTSSLILSSSSRLAITSLTEVRTGCLGPTPRLRSPSPDVMSVSSSLTSTQRPRLTMWSRYGKKLLLFFFTEGCMFVVLAADAGGWGQPPAAANGGGWEPEVAPEAPAADPVQDQESMVIDQPSPSSSDSVHELVDLDPQPQGDIEAEPADQAPPAPDLEVIVANLVAPDADMPSAAQGHDAEPEEDVPMMEEAQDDNPLAIVLYKPPQIHTDNLFVGAARVVYGPPLREFYPGHALLMLSWELLLLCTCLANYRCQFWSPL
ncbi:hypothetical protein D1007_27902 [Hordeum vulgare]|nr:hypothetical protein D1007_27902 [Hordeum vulgare]